MNGPTPVSVNLVVTLRCDYKCVFCFGHLHDLKQSPSDARILEIPRLLSKSGCEKLTLTGGEPFLFKELDILLLEAKKAGLTTCVVTNSSQVTEEKIRLIANNTDWLALSIDSASDTTEAELGRGWGTHVSQTKKVAQWVHKYGINLKVNTVVNKLTYREDMTGLIEEIRPDRWKVFQMLLIEGENKDRCKELSIEPDEFYEFIARNRRIAQAGIPFIQESTDDMIGSYVMLLPDGRFFSNHDGKHCFGTKTIFDIGVQAALEEVGWDEVKFRRRGGFYDWSRKKDKEFSCDLERSG